MALHLGASRDALIEAGSAPDKADRAAEELAGCERRFTDPRGDVRDLAADAMRQFGDARGATDRQFVEVRAASWPPAEACWRSGPSWTR